jgi:hypothetical protein
LRCLGLEDIREALREQLQQLPLYLQRPESESRVLDGHDGGNKSTVIREIEVPMEINVKSLTTVSHLIRFVEAPFTGLLSWGGGGSTEVEKRRAKWGDKYESENKKINQILSSYCCAKFSLMSADMELGSKQELGKKAQAYIEQKEGNYSGLYNSELSQLHYAAYKASGWCGVARSVFEEAENSKS